MLFSKIYYLIRRKANYSSYSFILLCLLLFVFTSCIKCCTHHKRDSRIALLNNGYENILIAIGDEIKPNKNLIQRIKTVFTEASELLFNATNQRAYFREIIILIPDSWDLPEVEIFQGTWESFDRADICISQRDRNTSIAPFVYNYASGCGEQGLHLHLSTEFLTNTIRANMFYGQYKNVLVHEWSHLRYGVFDEHSTRNDESEFYINEKNEIDAIRCSNFSEGTISDPIYDRCEKFLPNGLPNPQCIFEDKYEPESSGNTRGSIMYRPFLPTLTSFCDNNPSDLKTLHNRFAPNQQNFECMGKSVWEVMREHVDFDKDRNQPNAFIDNVKPFFRLVKRSPRRMLLLIDKSISSFGTIDRVLALKRALNDFVNLMLNDDDLVAVIHFDTMSKIVMKFTEVRNMATRKTIADIAFPKQFSEKVPNIWSALSLGLEMLKRYDFQSYEGANLILISDAKIIRYPNRERIFETLKATEIVVDTIALNVTADKNLELLAHVTNGLSHRLSDHIKALSLSGALKEISNRDINFHKRIFTTYSDFIFVHSESSYSFSIYMDSFISKRPNSFVRFQFTFEYNELAVNINVKESLTSRIHNIHDSNLCQMVETTVNDKTGLEIKCDFIYPDEGLWIIEIVNPYKAEAHVLATVTSYMTKNPDLIGIVENEPEVSEIRVESLWKHHIVHYPQIQVLYVLVSKQDRPIINAKVRATILSPNGDLFYIDLDDDGLHADRYKNDGVYSKYFTSYNSNGSYSAYIEVESDQFTSVHKYKIAGKNEPGNSFPSIRVYASVDHNAYKPIESFQRTLQTTSFLVKNLKPDVDLIRPSQIKDFKIEEMNFYERTVTFSFTAPGDDGDMGTAAIYEIQMVKNEPNQNVFALFFDYTDVSDNDTYSFEQNVEIENVKNTGKKTAKRDKSDLNLITPRVIEATFQKLKPNICGKRESFVLRIENNNVNDVMLIKIRAIDSSNNKGRWSKVNQFKLTGIFKTADGISFLEKNKTASLLTKNETSTGKWIVYLSRRSKLTIMSIAIVFAILLVLCVFFAAWMIVRFSRSSKRIKNTKSLLSIRV